MTKKDDKTVSYRESDVIDADRTARPIPAPGIGRRISEAAKRLGNRTSAYTVMGTSSAALQRYIKEENNPPFDALARLCVAASVSLDWLATGEGEMMVAAREAASDMGSHGARLDRGTLRLAADVLERALESANASTDSAGRAELLVAIYELLEQGAALEAAQRLVVTMLRAASKAAGVPSKQG